MNKPIKVENNADSLINIIESLSNSEATEKNVKRVAGLIEYIMHPYNEIQIDENVFQYTHNDQPENFYYKVNTIKMSPEDYQQYLEKKLLNEKLAETLACKPKMKQLKI